MPRIRPRPALCLIRLRLLAALFLPALCAGCDFFSLSLYPGYLAQAEASFELGSRVDAFLASLGGGDLPWHAEVFVLRDPSDQDYGAVRIEIENLPDGMLVLADPSGGVQQLSSSNLGRLHLADMGGSFVVGSMSFPPGGLPGASEITLLGSERYKLGFATASSNYLLWTDGTDSSMLQFASRTPAWGGGVILTAPIDYSTGFDLRGVYYDPSALDREVILVFQSYNSNQVFVFFTPASAYAGGFPTTPPTLREQFPPLMLQDVDGNRVMYTRKGIVVADWDGRSTLYDFNLADTGKKLDLGQGGEVQVAFNLDGDTFYAFDSERRVLYRGKTGW